MVPEASSLSAHSIKIALASFASTTSLKKEMDSILNVQDTWFCRQILITKYELNVVCVLQVRVIWATPARKKMSSYWGSLMCMYLVTQMIVMS